MAYYLSECVILHPRFGVFTASQLASACVLLARVLLGLDYPWSLTLLEATGWTVADLRMCCLAVYEECLTDKNVVIDCRKVKLQAVTQR